MTSTSGSAQLVFVAIAVVVLGLAFAGIVWIGRVIRGELGPGAATGGDAGSGAEFEQVPPGIMKEAIARGLVVPAQLAAMTPIERTFLFASLKQKLAAQDAAPAAQSAPLPHAPPPPAPAAKSPAPLAAPAPAPTPALPAVLPPEMLAALGAEKLRAWCPMCGTELQLPAFPPLQARCAKCGMKSAIRAEEGGRYVVIVSPPPKLS